MRLSPLVARLQDGAAAEGLAAWRLHNAALAAQARGEDVIVLSVGDPDLDTPAHIRDAAIAALADGDTHYTPIPGRPALRTAVADAFAPRLGRALGPRNVMIGAGAQNALYLTCQCLLGPGDEAISPEPTYISYAATVAAAGAHLIRTLSDPETGFRPDLDALAAAVTPSTRALLIGDPNNPTGVTLTAQERARIAEIAHSHDLWVLADTVYESLCYERSYAFLAAEPGLAERTITLGGVSKSHAMTGWRVGWAIGPEEPIAALEALAHCALYGLPGFVQTGALAALADRAAAEAIRETFRARRDLLVEILARVPGLRPLRPEAGMFTLLDIRALSPDAGAFAQSLFETEGVAVLDAAAFGPSARGWLRVSAALSEDRLADAGARIRRFCARL